MTLNECGAARRFVVERRTFALWPFVVALVPTGVVFGATLHGLPSAWMLGGAVPMGAAGLTWMLASEGLRKFTARTSEILVAHDGVTVTERGRERRLAFAEYSREFALAEPMDAMAFVRRRATLVGSPLPADEFALAVAEAAETVLERTEGVAWAMIDRGQKNGAKGPDIVVEIRAGQPCSVQVMGAPDVGCVDEAAGTEGERRRYRVPTRLDAPGEGRACLKLVPLQIEALP
jgi:hypothetical protein